MRENRFFSVRAVFLLTAVLVAGAPLAGEVRQDQNKRPMEFMDIMGMREAGAPDFSHDSKWALYTLSNIDWEENKNFTDLYLTSIETGEVRQLTFTADKNERSPEWSPAGGYFAFLSDREGKKTQLYFMRQGGGEAWRVTDQKDGVGSFRFSEDGNYLAFTAGKAEARQLWLIDLSQGPDDAKPAKFTEHDTPVQSYWWSPASDELYFTAPDGVDKDNQKRKKKGFNVTIVDEESSPNHLWVIGTEEKEEKRLTESDEYTVSGVVVSDDGRWVAFRGDTTDRHAGRSGSSSDSELYRIDRQSGTLTRLTNNDALEGGYTFSRDSQWLAFTAPLNFERRRQTELYVMAADGAPGSWRMLTGGFDRARGGVFWSLDGKRLYFNVNQGVKSNLFHVARTGGEVTQFTHHDASIRISFNRDAQRLVIRYSDPHAPADYYVSQLNQLDERSQWARVTDANPQAAEFQLAQYETVRWKSSDGKEIEGILIYPIGYEKGKRYPLIVQIHGGPASSYTNSFSGTYRTYTHIYAVNGYALFQPNYRGSAGYGERFRMEIAGDYFRQAFDDIELGVDYLIERGIADPDKLGYMGWSAGGHWSNWTLVKTDRYKAISTGAGAVNWISLYAQTDVQPPREFYFKGKPWENWDHYVDVSPLKYIQNAKTPTLIHFGEQDERIPMPQGKELHMALKKLGVPTEFIVYPGQPHGIRNRRYQMVKMQAEFYWFEKWIKGREGWLDWKAMLGTLKEEEGKKED